MIFNVDNDLFYHPAFTCGFTYVPKSVSTLWRVKNIYYTVFCITTMPLQTELQFSIDGALPQS